jgi:nicotinamidase-related amidase
MQQRLLAAIPEAPGLIEGCVWLVRAANAIGVPVAAVEQYSQGLGATHEALRALIEPEAIAAKRHFSCVEANCLQGLPGADRAQTILIGVEAHVCVLQTALGLRLQGREVYVAADCTASRRFADRDLALARMRQEGVRIVTREMIVFEWLKQAPTPLFRRIHREFLR